MNLPRGVRSAGLALLAAAAVLWVCTIFAETPLLRGLETASLDLRFRLRGPRPPGGEATVVLVDDRSLAALGRWPLPRTRFAQAVRLLHRAGAKVVVFDLLFAEPDEPLPADLRAAARQAASGLDGAADKELRAALLRLGKGDPDGNFAEAMREAGNVLLPVGFTFTGEPAEAPDWLSDSAYAGFDKSPVAPNFPLRPVAAVPPVAILGTAAAGLGHTSIAYDLDGEPRYDYAALPFEADFLPSLPLRAAAAWLGVPWSKVSLALGEGVHIGDIFVPTDPAMRLVVNYRGPRGTFPTWSFVDLLDGKVPQAALAGHVVLIGASFLGASDSFAAPFGSTQLPGVERMANIVDTIVQHDFITELPASGHAVVAAAVLVVAALAGAFTELLPTRFAAAAGALPLAGWFAGAQWMFLRGVWLPLIEPLFALAAAALAVLLFRYWVVDRDGRLVRSAFRHYMAPELLTVLGAHPERLRLGGDTRPMTIMFCDVRGFTSISEGFKANPDGLTRLINRFLTPMSDIIMSHRGTIDKYIGDCIMAFWNAPLDDPEHADHACATALAMMAGLERLNEELTAEAAAEGRKPVPLHIGIGINTGECVVGNMGSDRRFDYSVLGDAVNLASRLESQSKTYGVCIVIGEDTRAAAPGWAALELDRIAVKGKREAVRIYALLGDPEAAGSAQFRALAEPHERMLESYRRQDWDGARSAIARCRGRDPRLEGLYDLYLDRIAHFIADPPEPGWDGVYVATEK